MDDVTSLGPFSGRVDRSGVRAALVSGRWLIERLEDGVIVGRAPAPTRTDAERVAARVSLRDGVRLLPTRIAQRGETRDSPTSQRHRPTALVPADATDRAWFAAHPGRAFTVRVVSREEASRWISPPGDDEISCCVIRRFDGEGRRFILPGYIELSETDEELQRIFDELPSAREPSFEMFRPRPGGTLAQIEAGLSRLLLASVPFEPDEPPAQAYREEMRARGCEVLALGGGSDALAYLLDRVAKAMPARAEIHAAILQVAWDGLVELQP